jgi:hypothetical protein
MVVFLAAGNVAFWHFDPEQRLWRRLLKVAVPSAVTDSLTFGRFVVNNDW